MITSQHEEHLKKLFARLQKYGLIINEDKSHFFQQKVEYLGFEITPQGYRPDGNNFTPKS